MYKKFYGLKEKPFHLTPNPQFLYLSKKHQNALTYLEYGLSEGSGFILLTGDIGAGKTTIIRHILNRIEDDIDVGVISNTNVDSDELISLVLHEFGVEGSFDNKAKSLDAIFHYLITKYSQGKRVLLVIDEAQNLSIKSLEEVRMLSNLQTDEHMLLQIMLVGQPDLRKKLQSAELTQLSQRIAVYYHLGALERDELAEYIAFRLEKVGGSLDIFERDTFDLIYQASGGIPRIINLLCDTALVYGYAESLQRINIDIVSQVIRDKEGFGLISNEHGNGADALAELEQHDNSQMERLQRLEEKIADLQQQMDRQTENIAQSENQATDRLVIELTTLLRHEREKTDKLLLEYSLLKAGLGVYAHAEKRTGGAPPLPIPAIGSGEIGQHNNVQENNDTVFTRISSATIPMIDLHCHILPDIDDGPKNFDESMAMVRLAAADGIAAIVATPHLNDRLYDPVEISRRVSWLNHLLHTEDLPVSIMPGADVSVLFSPAQVQGFTINDTEYILVEFPHTHLPRNANEILAQFVASGYKPVITHPERNPSIMSNPQLLLDLMGENRYVQITAGSLTGEFGKAAQQCGQHLLRSGVVDVIATDAHSSTHRKPQLSGGVKAAAEIVGAEAAQRMVFGTPAKIISGLSL